MKPEAIKSVAALLEARAREFPDRVAYRYVGETTGPRELTYDQLRRAAYAYAAQLREGGRQGDRVLLQFPPGLEFIEAFFGCMVAGMVAVPAPPPNPLKPKRSLDRLVSIVESAWPSWALTTASVLSAIRPALAESPAFDGIRWLAVDTIAPMTGHIPPVTAVAPNTVALIQYTSGSTSDPKGAALTHQNILHNVQYFDEGWDHTHDSVVVNWLPAFHDLGLLYGIITPMWGGFMAVQMSPIDVIQRPFSWLETMSNFRATHSGGPNFMYELCSRKITEEERLTLDLGSWKMALNAAEPVRAETMERFVGRFGSVGFSSRTFSPGYGLSEGTCKVTALSCDEEATILSVRADRLEQDFVEVVPEGLGTRTVVGCGRPGSGVSIAIVDPDTRTARGAGEVGEIWVSGPSVADSYWNQPTDTEEQLRARVVGGDGTPFLRTGDMGFMHQGQLFITGRIKDLIIVRGNNHYPQDIEFTVQDAHSSIRAGCVAAFSYEDDGEEKLAVVAEVERRYTQGWGPSPDRRVAEAAPGLPMASGQFSPEEVVASITRAISEAHGLKVSRVELIKAGSISKTTSGKIQRRATKRAMLSGRLDRVASLETSSPTLRPTGSSRGALRARIIAVVSDCAAIPKDKLRPDESLHRYGIDSLTGVNIAYEVGLLAGRDVPSGLLAEHDTVEKLVDFVLAAGGMR
ncbi:MAG: AMP-binding protein [Myxococcales bacterium]|nr:AMP-binding protein [Myxococcales bacterium]